MRGLFHDYQEAYIISKRFLLGLPNTNRLKPKVWAKNKKKPCRYGVSLGVGTFVRPLYLCIKMSKLADDETNRAQTNRAQTNRAQTNRAQMLEPNDRLEDAKAFRIQEYKRDKKAKKDEDENKDDDENKEEDDENKEEDDENKEEDDKVVLPCLSCQAFFNRTNTFSQFGNCAEYDVIRTSKSSEVLRNIKGKKDWKVFESACQEHFDAFKELKRKLEANGDSSEHLKTYYARTRNAKVLEFEWNSEKQDLELVVKNWIPEPKKYNTTRSTITLVIGIFCIIGIVLYYYS